jgi:hypothetical protein
MIKIKSLFQRHRDGDFTVFNEIVPGSEWVQEGIGYATRKWDGMAILVKEGVLYGRLLLKRGKTAPSGFLPAQPEPDPITGQQPGWVKLEGKNLKRVMDCVKGTLQDGTYEYCGPTVGTRHGANPERMTEHVLIPHGIDVLEDCPREFEALREYFNRTDIEGVVWYHPDGRMVKLKLGDFGISRRQFVV